MAATVRRFPPQEGTARALALPPHSPSLPALNLFRLAHPVSDISAPYSTPSALPGSTPPSPCFSRREGKPNLPTSSLPGRSRESRLNQEGAGCGSHARTHARTHVRRGWLGGRLAPGLAPRRATGSRTQQVGLRWWQLWSWSAACERSQTRLRLRLRHPRLSLCAGC